MPTSSFQQFDIHAGTFDFGVHVVLSSDIPRVIKYVNNVVGYEFADENTFKCQGKVIFSEENRYYPVMWLPEYPQTVKQIATLNHELLHIVFRIVGWAHITHCEHSEEVYCHLMGHLTKQFYALAKNRQRKPKKS